MKRYFVNHKMLYSLINIINFAVSQMIAIIVTIGIHDYFFPSLRIPWFGFCGLLEEVGLSWLRDGAKGNAVFWVLKAQCCPQLLMFLTF